MTKVSILYSKMRDSRIISITRGACSADIVQSAEKRLLDGTRTPKEREHAGPGKKRLQMTKI